MTFAAADQRPGSALRLGTFRSNRVWPIFAFKFAFFKEFAEIALADFIDTFGGWGQFAFFGYADDKGRMALAFQDHPV